MALNFRDADATLFRVTTQAKPTAELEPVAKRARPTPTWVPTKAALVAKVQEMRDLANATEVASRGKPQAKVFALGKLLPILDSHLLGDDAIGTDDIRALASVKGVGPTTIDWLLQLHASGECDYLTELRRRARE